jgi:hypothetical protein
MRLHFFSYTKGTVFQIRFFSPSIFFQCSYLSFLQCISLSIASYVPGKSTSVIWHTIGGGGSFAEVILKTSLGAKIVFEYCSDLKAILQVDVKDEPLT